MTETKVDFAALPWDAAGAGARSKSFKRGGRQLRLVELTCEFDEREWCLRGHVGCVLEGVLEITFAGRTESYAAGDGIFIAGGEKERHRARASSTVVRLMLVEEA